MFYFTLSVFIHCMYIIVLYLSFFFFFKQKTAYEMRISDWSSDVCSSDLLPRHSTVAIVKRRKKPVERIGCEWKEPDALNLSECLMASLSNAAIVATIWRWKACFFTTPFAPYV